jgi:hypothetical protein
VQEEGNRCFLSILFVGLVSTVPAGSTFTLLNDTVTFPSDTSPGSVSSPHLAQSSPCLF